MKLFAKMWIGSVLCSLLFLNLPHFTYANTPIKAYVNGAEIKFDQPPIVLNGSTVVPLRAIFTALGATIEWDSYTRTVEATRGTTTIQLTIGNNTAMRNGEKVTLSTPGQIIQNSTYVPLRFVSEALGSQVAWNAETRTIQILDGVANPTSKMSAEQIFKNANPAVAYVECYGFNNNIVASGSGFMVSADGKFVTNYHVIYDAANPVKYVKIKFGDGAVYNNVVDILGYDQANDTAVLKIPNVSNRPFLKIGKSDNIVTGEQVYAIGSPLGLENTISQGIISTKKRVLDGIEFIQISVPIDSGSSGGPLLNAQGEVIGITTGGFQSNASLNLAVPIKVYSQLALTNRTTISQINNSGKSVSGLISGEVDIEEIEPNNNYGTEDLLTHTTNYISGTLANSDDLDLYQFTINRTYEVTVIGLLASYDNHLNNYFNFFIADYTNGVLRSITLSDFYTSNSYPYDDYYAFTIYLNPGKYVIFVNSVDSGAYYFDVIPRDYDLLVVFE